MGFTPLEEILTGKTDQHTAIFEDSIRVHKEILIPLKELSQKASSSGFQLQVISGFRSFERQIEIWNKKVQALFPKEPKEICEEILRWSALPGTSRHHWGTDLDVIDRNQVQAGMKVNLVPEEFSPGGPFCEFHDWLDENMGTLGFFRPYQTDRGGVSPERWHLSYAPLANHYLTGLSEELVCRALEQSSILLKSEVIRGLPQVFSRYVKNIDTYPSVN